LITKPQKKKHNRIKKIKKQRNLNIEELYKIESNHYHDLLVTWNLLSAFLQEGAYLKSYEFYAAALTASVVWWLACWPLVPEFTGSNPAEVVGFFRYMEKSSACLPLEGK
jgi:hypothetical protein